MVLFLQPNMTPPSCFFIKNQNPMVFFLWLVDDIMETINIDNHHDNSRMKFYSKQDSLHKHNDRVQRVVGDSNCKICLTLENLCGAGCRANGIINVEELHG